MADDLIGPDGKETKPTLVIRDLIKETARDPKTGGEKIVPVLTFRSTPRKVRVNRSSMKMLVRAWGSESTNWLGKTVTLWILPSNLKDKITGEPKNGILVRPDKGQATKAEPTPPTAGPDLSIPDEEIPQ